MWHEVIKTSRFFPTPNPQILTRNNCIITKLYRCRWSFSRWTSHCPYLAVSRLHQKYNEDLYFFRLFDSVLFLPVEGFPLTSYWRGMLFSCRETSLTLTCTDRKSFSWKIISGNFKFICIFINGDEFIYESISNSIL